MSHIIKSRSIDYNRNIFSEKFVLLNALENYGLLKLYYTQRFNIFYKHVYSWLVNSFTRTTVYDYNKNNKNINTVCVIYLILWPYYVIIIIHLSHVTLF